MATFAIGDVQGCFEALMRLLDAVGFAPTRDRLWFTGDLVNRGPDSLATLRFVRDLGPRAVTVLGNHDLHLLARASGGRAGRLDTLDAVLEAPDRDSLLDWLRACPLLHEARVAGTDWLMVHAGIPPGWTLATARAAAHEVEASLRHDASAFLGRLYGDEPARWADALALEARQRFTVNACTRMRFCHEDGRLELRSKGSPGSAAVGLTPWFSHALRVSLEAETVFGHWSTLGRVHWPAARAWGLDTGAVWGGRLTALCLETRGLTSVDCPENQRPGIPTD